MKKDANGMAGAVRIQQLKLADITRAEKHGKRLDQSSKSRAIYKDAPPLTTTGLNLRERFQEHVDGVFIPKAKAKAMHVIVQLPKDLVDGENAGHMLKHARAFVEGVFGKESIFGDRVDRDEKGRHVVDLFVAPIYIKKTKHTEKRAVSMSRDLKALATKYGRKTNVYETGRALQDALFDYLRNEMGLIGVQRGSSKLVPGPDWKSAEQLRDDELKEQEAIIEIDRVQAEKAGDEARAMLAAARTEQAATAADRIRQEKAAWETQLNFQRLEDEREQVRQLMFKAEESERRASLAAAGARGEVKLLRAEQAELASEQQQFGAAMGLLHRGLDEQNGLFLQPSVDQERGFLVVEGKLLPGEAAVYDRWPKALRPVAIIMAKMMEGLRTLQAKVKRRDLDLDERQEAMNARERQLDERQKELERNDVDLLGKAAVAAEQLEDARREVDRVHQVHQAQLAWATILKWVADGKFEIPIGADGVRGTRAADGRPAPTWMLDRLKGPMPAWADTSLKLMATLDTGAVFLEQQQREVALHAAVLKEVVDRADEAFTQAQKVAVTDASKVLAITPGQLAARLAAQDGRGVG